MKSKVFWCEVADTTPFQIWWSELSKAETHLSKLEIERWDASTSKWSQVLDSLRSFSLFAKAKLVLFQNAEKSLKKMKPNELKELFENLQNSSQYLILQSSEPPPAKWPFAKWESQHNQADDLDEKAVFKWLDSIQASQFQRSLDELETCILSGTHPLVCLQMVTRHFRMGRLIQYANRKGISDLEIQDRVKIHRFIIQKWKRAKNLNESQWKAIFDRLARLDLHLKSGHEPIWSLRQLSFDLIRIQKSNSLGSYSRSLGPEAFA